MCIRDRSKPFTYVDDEYAECAIRCSRTYYEYAKDICENYRMDLPTRPAAISHVLW